MYFYSADAVERRTFFIYSHNSYAFTNSYDRLTLAGFILRLQDYYFIVIIIIIIIIIIKIIIYVYMYHGYTQVTPEFQKCLHFNI
jgi:hypothetical protein